MWLRFTFDESFWSLLTSEVLHERRSGHDGFEDDGTGYLRPLPGGKYADQRYVCLGLGCGGKRL